MKHVFSQNADDYEFVHHVHAYDVISATGWKSDRRWVNPLDGVELNDSYKLALETALKPTSFVVKATHPDDVEAADVAASTTRGYGNIPASTHQFLKRSRAWKDAVLGKEDEYAAIVFTRFDSNFSNHVKFPSPSDLKPSTYYAVWNDKRHQVLDDRFALVTPPYGTFFETWGQRACELVATQTEHFMPENINQACVAEAGLSVSYLSDADPMKIGRFTDNDLAELQRFVEAYSG